MSYRTSKVTKTKIYFGKVEENFVRKRNQHFRQTNKYFLLIDAGLPPEHQSRIMSTLEEMKLDFDFYFLPQGEESKSIESAVATIRSIILSGITRKDKVVVCGGGAVLDSGNFIASVLLRGVSSILVPTTLLSMVDAGIGGKNALNLDSIKNQVGTFHQPEAIFIDLSFLGSLPDDELKSGLGEVVKTLFLSGNRKVLKRLLEKGICEEVVRACAEYKCRIVKDDPFETKNRRAVLNFGHTVGHAVEAASGERIKHGHAVAAGMFVEQKIAEIQLSLETSVSSLLKEILGKFEFDMSFLKELEIAPFLKFDKKIHEEGKIRFVYLQEFGKPKILSLNFQDFEETYRKVIRDIS